MESHIFLNDDVYNVSLDNIVPQLQHFVTSTSRLSVDSRVSVRHKAILHTRQLLLRLH